MWIIMFCLKTMKKKKTKRLIWLHFLSDWSSPAPSGFFCQQSLGMTEHFNSYKSKSGGVVVYFVPPDVFWFFFSFPPTPPPQDRRPVFWSLKKKKPNNNNNPKRLSIKTLNINYLSNCSKQPPRLISDGPDWCCAAVDRQEMKSPPFADASIYPKRVHVLRAHVAHVALVLFPPSSVKWKFHK